MNKKFDTNLEEGNMGKKLFVFTLAGMMILGLVFLNSCAEQQVKTDELQEEKQTEVSETTQETAEKTEATAEDLEEEAIRLEEKRAQEAFENKNIHFAFDKSTLTEEARVILKRKATWLKNHPDAKVIVEGHCDERGTEEYNLALGDRRAKSAKNFLVDMGIDSSRLTTISYGEEKPLDPRHNETAWAKNRRAHFRIR